MIWHHDVPTNIPLMPGFCRFPFIYQDFGCLRICEYGLPVSRASRDKENSRVNPNSIKSFEMSHECLQMMRSAEASCLGYRFTLWPTSLTSGHATEASGLGYRFTPWPTSLTSDEATELCLPKILRALMMSKTKRTRRTPIGNQSPPIL